MSLSTLNLVPLSDITDLPAYETADIFPMYPANSAKTNEGHSEQITLLDLAASLELNGMREPIILFNGTILDGRNRRAAAVMAKLEHVPVQEFTGTEEEADQYVLDLNVDRRNMSAGQRACVAVRMWDIEAHRASLRLAQAGASSAPGRPAEKGSSNLSEVSGSTAKILADRFRCSNSYVTQARKLWLNDRDTFLSVHSGRKSMGEVVVNAPPSRPKNVSKSIQRATQSIADVTVTAEQVRDMNQDERASAIREAQKLADAALKVASHAAAILEVDQLTDEQAKILGKDRPAQTTAQQRYGAEVRAKLVELDRFCMSHSVVDGDVVDDTVQFCGVLLRWADRIEDMLALYPHDSAE